MGKSLILWPNLVDDSVTQPEFSGGGWLIDAPITNVRDDGIQTGYLAYFARSATTDTADTTFTIDHGQPVAMKAAAIPNGNFSVDATITVERSDISDFSTVLASVTEPVYRVIYPVGTVPATSPFFITGKPARRLPKMPWIGIFPDVNVAQYTRISITDPSNPDGYIQFPRLFLAPGFEPKYNASVGAALKPVTRTVIQEAPISGARFYDERQPGREWRITYDSLPEAELWAQIWDMQVTLGVSGQAFFILDPDDSANLHRHSFHCTLVDPSGIVLDKPLRGGATLSLLEVIA